MFTAIYVQPMGRLVMLTLMGVLLFRGLWCCGIRRGWEKKMRKIAGLLMVLWIFVVLWATLGRQRGERTLQLIPFYDLYLGFTENREMFRTMFMNVLLFFPGGFLAGMLLKNRGNWKWVSLCMILGSLMIEGLQYGLQLGCAEVDDVICNGFGGFLGLLGAKVGSKS